MRIFPTLPHTRPNRDLIRHPQYGFAELMFDYLGKQKFERLISIGTPTNCLFGYFQLTSQNNDDLMCLNYTFIVRYINPEDRSRLLSVILHSIHYWYVAGRMCRREADRSVHLPCNVDNNRPTEVQSIGKKTEFPREILVDPTKMCWYSDIATETPRQRGK